MTDVWSDGDSKSYMAITVHWIAKVTEMTSSLQLKAVLIAFHHLCGGHDGKALANAVLSLLDRVGVTVKV